MFSPNLALQAYTFNCSGVVLCENFECLNKEVRAGHTCSCLTWTNVKSWRLVGTANKIIMLKVSKTVDSL